MGSDWKRAWLGLALVVAAPFGWHCRAPSDGAEARLAAAHPTSFLGPFFSYPYNTAGEVEDLLMDATVHLRVADLFAGVTASTTVRGAVYIWRYEDFGAEQGRMTGPAVSSPKLFTEAVQAALARGGTTDARFIVDQKYMNQETRDAFSRLGLHVIEDDSSASDDGIMHSKFFTFSALEYPAGGAPVGYPERMTHVVAVLSANIDNGMYRAANNLLIMHGNPELYQTFVDLWEYIRTHPDAQRADAISRLCHDVYAFSFPRRSDPIVRILDKVIANMSTDDPPEIRVSMYLFSRNEIRDRLIWLAGHGAKVRVVLTSFNQSGDARNRELEDVLDANGVSARLLPNRRPGVMHSKYILVDANYELQGEVKRRKLVWTGSHNYTRSALRENDEVLVRSGDPNVYGSYLADWKLLWTLAGR